MQASNWQKSCLVAAVAFMGGAGSLRLYEQSGCPGSPLRLHDFACLTTTAEPAASPSLRSEVSGLIEAAQAEGKLIQAGVVFQRLSDGFGFSLGDDNRFVPASLLKLPVAFAALALEAQQPGALAEEVPYAPEQAAGCAVLPQDETSDTSLTVGQRYSLESMLRAVIVHSDNLSYCIVAAFMNQESDRRTLIARTFRELAIQDPRDVLDEAASVREYAGLFRLLYNTAYLDAAGSAKLLGWLSESAYDKGIEAGLPKGSRVANKFGERSTEEGTHYLHDCGIVYQDDEPYVLCVMTKGRNFASLQEHIARVSGVVYSAVASGQR